MRISIREAFIGKKPLRDWSQQPEWKELGQGEWSSKKDGLIPYIVVIDSADARFYHDQNVTSSANNWFINEDRNCIVDFDGNSALKDKELIFSKVEELLANGKFDKISKSSGRSHIVRYRDFFEL